MLVSNGYANGEVIDQLTGLVDAANIDLKGLTPSFCQECGFDPAVVRQTIARLATTGTHVEVTTLVVPGRNDTPAEIATIAQWLHETSDDIAYHVTRVLVHLGCAAPLLMAVPPSA